MFDKLDLNFCAQTAKKSNDSFRINGNYLLQKDKGFSGRRVSITFAPFRADFCTLEKNKTLERFDSLEVIPATCLCAYVFAISPHPSLFSHFTCEIKS